MVNDISLAPLGLALPRFFFALGRPTVEQQVVDLVLAELAERLLSERLDSLQVRQLKREDGQAVLRAVVDYVVVRLLGPGRVSCAEYDLVRLCLAEELLDGFEALGVVSRAVFIWLVQPLTKPEETPVATIVFAVRDIFYIVIFVSEFELGSKLLYLIHCLDWWCLGLSDQVISQQADVRT